jgi:hypothetical protein
VLGIAAGLGEVGVRVFQDWILIAVTELIGEAGVAVVMVLFVVRGAFGAVGIVVRNFGHGLLLIKLPLASAAKAAMKVDRLSQR